MSTEIHLRPDQVPAHLKGPYTGRKFQLVVTETVTIPADAGLWQDGSRERYLGMDLATGDRAIGGFNRASPWDTSRRDTTVTIPPGRAVVRETILRGKDMGLTFYITPADATPLLSAPVELTEHERAVLKATAEFKSSYGGQSRYEMARDRASWNTAAPAFPTPAEWDAAKGALAERKLLTRAGAITPAGRNAIGG